MNHRINKAALISKIQQDDGLSNEEKSALMGLLNEQKKYGIVWEESPEEVEENLRSHIPVLREVKERALTEGGSDASNHILLEGDNLDALTTLCFTHEGKIDVIYIDPPYNTGNKDFVYNDNYVDSEDSYRHSKWLSFMSRRLKIAKRLLSDKGVIFISIDENEEAQLRLLGDEIFTQSNFVGQWNWFKSATPPALSKKIKRNIEYVLCWQKGGNSETFKGVQKTSSSNDPFTKPQNSYKTLTFPPLSINCKMQDGLYSSGIYGTDKFPNELLDDLIVENGKNKNQVRFKNRFIWLQSTLDENINNGLYIELSKRLVLSYKRGEYAPEVPPNLIDLSVGVDTTENAGRQLAELFNGEQVFDYPKPVSLIKYILNFPYNRDITILDFFAGSGTTLHATMLLNAEDGGHRQCILVTNNENQICEQVTYQRNKRVIQGYTTPKGQEVEGLHNNNLRYYQIDHTQRVHTHENRKALAEAMVELLQIKNGAYEAPSCFGGLKVKPRYMRYFRGDNDVLIVYFPEIIPHLVNEIKAMSFNSKLQVYVAIDGNYPFADEFAPVASKVDVVAIPSVYYHALKHVLPEASGEPVPDDTPNDGDAELLNEANKNDYQD